MGQADKQADLDSNKVPKQQIGSEMNAVEKRAFNSEQEAKDFYQLAKLRLLEVYNWAEICKLPMPAFTLTDSSGKALKRLAQEKDYIKIDIPGPGPALGGGFDWVILESIDEETINGMEQISMRVRPVANPLRPDQEVAHFLKDTATSTFQVKRIGKELYAEEHGRNEVPNADTDHILDNVRNTVVGWSAKIGLSYPQWKSLVKGLLS